MPTANSLMDGGNRLNSGKFSRATLRVLILECSPLIRWRHPHRARLLPCRSFLLWRRIWRSILKRAGWLSPITPWSVKWLLPVPLSSLMCCSLLMAGIDGCCGISRLIICMSRFAKEFPLSRDPSKISIFCTRYLPKHPHHWCTKSVTSAVALLRILAGCAKRKREKTAVVFDR